MGFLCVIKDCGAEGKGMLSFPRPGMSIAMDFPDPSPRRRQALVDRLNELVIAEGGRIYLTKDTFTRPEHFRAMEPRLEAFNAVRRKWDPQGRLRSAQSVRLLGRPRMKAVLFGATKGMGRALARLMAERGDRLFLLEHIAEELERSAARPGDSRGAGAGRNGLLRSAAAGDLRRRPRPKPNGKLGGFDTVVVTAGLFAHARGIGKRSAAWRPGC